MTMDRKTQFAEEKDEIQLREIMLDYGMDIPGDIEEQIIIKEGLEVLAGGKVVEYADSYFFVEVIGVKEEARDRGYGGILLKQITQNPWNCCKYPLTNLKNQDSFKIATIARGEAKGFYEKYGFEACDFSEIPVPYREQCIECPDKEECKPVPMIAIKNNPINL
jgi:N-acetylglutamate synthase-like GNAT family acetyltransferase